MVIPRLLVIAAALTFLSGGAGHAQGGDRNPLRTDRNPLATAKTLKCKFTAAAVGSWKDGEAEVGATPGQNMALDIEEIDADGGTARVGGDHLTTVLTVSSLHFMNRTLQGSLNVTTVFSQKNPKGGFRAVRSQHDYLPTAIPGFVSEPHVSQHYGECEVGP